jgi:hypothetical protein
MGSNNSQLSTRNQAHSLYLNSLSGNSELLAQTRMVPNPPLDSLLLQRSLHTQQALQSLQPFLDLQNDTLQTLRDQQQRSNNTWAINNQNQHDNRKRVENGEWK